MGFVSDCKSDIKQIASLYNFYGYSGNWVDERKWEKKKSNVKSRKTSIRHTFEEEQAKACKTL